MVLYKPNAAKNHQNSTRRQGRIATGTGRRRSVGRMSETAADFLVIGSTPLARLLAGLLADTHGRTVVQVGESQSFYRLPRSIDLSVAPVTRPETWALLGEGRDETVKLVGRIAGRGAWTRLDPIFFTSAPRAAEALSHMRHMALDFGLAAEPAAPSLLGGGRAGIILRDALRLNRPLAEPALDAWLDRVGVRRLVPRGIAIAADGSAMVDAEGGAVAARQTVLADHEAILAHLPEQRWPALLRRHAAASILTTPTRPLAAPIMLELHSGVTLLQQAEGGIAAMGQEDMAHFSGRVHALLGEQRQVEQAGQAAYTALRTGDGAPALGRLGGDGPDIVAGMGMSGLFFAPALARWLCAAAAPHESAWFSKRLVTRTIADEPVAEFATGIWGEAA